MHGLRSRTPNENRYRTFLQRRRAPPVGCLWHGPAQVRRSSHAGQALIVHDDGQQTRCFAHVNDVVYAVTELMQHPQSYGQIYNIGSDSPVSILDVAKQVIAIVNPKTSIEFQSYTDAYDEDFEDIRRRVPDLARLKKAIEYTPRYLLADIIQDVWKYKQRNAG